MLQSCHGGFTEDFSAFVIDVREYISGFKGSGALHQEEPGGGALRPRRALQVLQSCADWDEACGGAARGLRLRASRPGGDSRAAIMLQCFYGVLGPFDGGGDSFLRSPMMRRTSWE